MRTGPSSALYDVRLGEDMHVLVGCGLGGGSLVNAGVALRPDARVFADEVWPGQIAQDGLLDEGFSRAERWLKPQSDPRAGTLTKYKALATAGKGLGYAPIAPTVTVSFEGGVNAAGRRPARLHALRRLLRRLQRRRQDLGGAHLSGGRRAPRRRALHACRRAPRRQGQGRRLDACTCAASMATAPRRRTSFSSAPIVVLGAGTLGSTEILLRSRANGLALSDRLGQRFSANGDIIAFGYGAKIPVDAIGVGYPPKIEGMEIGAAVSGQIEIDDAHDLAQELRVQEGVLPSALAPALPVLFIPNGRLLGALQSLIAGVYKGPFSKLQTFFAVSHDSASGRFVLEDDELRLVWPGAKDEPVYKRLDDDPHLDRHRGRRLLRQEPARRHRHGASAGDRASLGRRRHGA